MFDRLPTPWGLVRAGVAPDHPNIKAVSRVYEKTAAHPEFRFFGNVEIGRDITHEDLTDRYHAVIYAVGAADRPPHGHPGRGPARAAGPRPSSSPGTTATPTTATSSSTSAAERAVVVGNGNVAADVARMLALTREELAGDRRRRPRARRAGRAERRRRSSCSAAAARRRRRSRTPSCSSSAR